MEAEAARTLRACNAARISLARDRGDRHRMTLVASDVADAVEAAGGLLYDRTVIGWDVAVYLAQRDDDRALRILGVATALLDTPTAYVADTAWPDSLICSAAVLRSHTGVRKQFERTSVGAGRAEVAVWGAHEGLPVKFAGGRVMHQLTQAARAFKTQARTAAGLGGGVVLDYEEFHGGGAELDVAVSLQQLGETHSRLPVIAGQERDGGAPHPK